MALRQENADQQLAFRESQRREIRFRHDKLVQHEGRLNSEKAFSPTVFMIARLAALTATA